MIKIIKNHTPQCKQDQVAYKNKVNCVGLAYPDLCPRCKGSGKILSISGGKILSNDCPRCVKVNKCPRCGFQHDPSDAYTICINCEWKAGDIIIPPPPICNCMGTVREVE